MYSRSIPGRRHRPFLRPQTQLRAARRKTGGWLQGRPQSPALGTRRPHTASVPGTVVAWRRTMSESVVPSLRDGEVARRKMYSGSAIRFVSTGQRVGHSGGMLYRL
eukprot:3169449-Rhodomonas_salina.1